MYLMKCDRYSFAKLLSSKLQLPYENIIEKDSVEGIPLDHEDILLVWQDSPKKHFSLPDAAIVAEDSISNFLAWTITYFRNIRPFTAYCRVLTPSLAQLAISQKVNCTINSEVNPVFLGLILGEGVAYSAGRTDLNKLTFSAFARTLSFALAAGFNRYNKAFIKSGKEFDNICIGWRSIRELTNQPQLDLSSLAISDVWKLALKALSGDGTNQPQSLSEKLIVDALHEIKEFGKISLNTWHQFKVRPVNDSLLLNATTGPREGRVKEIEIAICDLALGSNETRKQRAFLAGYLTSLIQPGSLDHFQVLFKTKSELNESFLWYGVCSGFAPNSSMDSSLDSYGNGLGLLLKREIDRPAFWFDSPNCDIALSEIEILLRNREDQNVNIHTLAGDILKVEIFPMICTSVKWTTKKEEVATTKPTPLESRQMPMFAENERLRQDVLDLLQQITDSTIVLNDIRKTVENKFGEKNTRKRKR